MPNIGIIDSGVSASQALNVIGERSFGPTGDADRTKQHPPEDLLGHGSALTQIIQHQCPSARLLVARVFFDRLVCTPEQIASAIDWQIEQGAEIINMSFGLQADRTVLRQACQRALDAGLLLVASSPARGSRVFPAQYSGIIRATGDARCKPGEVSYLNSPQADFGGHVRAHGGKIAGASVGCAYITAALALILQQQPDLDRTTVIARLISQAHCQGPERRGITGTDLADTAIPDQVQS